MDQNEDGQSFSSQGQSVNPGVIASGPVSSTAADAKAAGLPHSFSAHRPTKVITNVSGDIVLAGTNTKKPLNKTPLITVGILAIIVLATIAIIPSFINNTGKAKTLMNDNLAYVRNLEKVFYDSYYGNTPVSQVFTEEKHAEINAAMAGFAALQQELAKISASSVKDLDSETYATIQARLNERVQQYQSSVNLYNILYVAYVENNADGLVELQKSEDYYTARMAERFYNYVIEKNNLQEVIDSNSCTSAEVSPLCSETLADYNYNETSLHDSTVVISAIFSTEGMSYVDSELISPAINKLIGDQN